jgi:hypothetical protein
MGIIKKTLLFVLLLNLCACSSSSDSESAVNTTEKENPAGIQAQSNLFSETYDFSISETYDKIGYEGFSVPEIAAGGIWTDSSVVLLNLPHKPDAFSTILFDVFPAVNEKNPEISIDVYLRDSKEKIDTWTFKTNETITPAILIKKGDERSDVLSLKLVIKNAKSPSELGTGTDTRKLGLFFEKITVFGFKE